MRYILTGFTFDTGCRVFAFQGIRDDNTRLEFTVRADLSLIRKYNIRLQELPLLCRGLLERRPETEGTRHLTLGEDGMRLYQEDCATIKQAAAQKKRPPRKPLSENAGGAWRASCPPRVEGRF